jgi:hypothetical protein
VTKSVALLARPAHCPGCARPTRLVLHRDPHSHGEMPAEGDVFAILNLWEPEHEFLFHCPCDWMQEGSPGDVVPTHRVRAPELASRLVELDYVLEKIEALAYRVSEQKDVDLTARLVDIARMCKEELSG